MRQILFASAAAIALAAAGAAHAADDKDTKVSELVVTGGLEEKLPEELAKTGIRVETFSDEQIRNGGYVDAIQTLQALSSSVSVVSHGGPFNYFDMSFQGGTSRDVLFLIDGVRLNNRLYPGTVPDTLPASVIDRIEVLDGGQALFYGTQSLSGAINIVTRSFSEEQRGSVTAGGDNWGGVHLDGYYGTRLGKHQVVLFGSYDQSDGGPSYRAADMQPSLTDRDRSYDVRTGGAKYAFNFTDKTRVSGVYYHTDAALDFLSRGSAAARTVLNQNYRDEDVVIGKFEHAFSDDVSLYLKGYYHKWDSTYSQIDNSLTAPGTTLVLENNTAWAFDDKGVNALAEINTGKLKYFVGYDYQNYGGFDDYLIIAPNRGETQAVFAQVRTTPEMFENGRLAAGVRYNKPSFGEEATVFNVSGEWNLTGSLFIRGSVGTNFRLPTAAELFAQDYEIGDPNLKPERAKGGNISIGGRFAKMEWEVIAFGQDIEDRIGYNFGAGPGGEDLYVNLASTVEVRGVEAVVRGELTPDLTMQASYTNDSTEMAGVGVQLDRVPKQTAKATLDWNPRGKKYGGTVSVNWTGDLFTVVPSLGTVNDGNKTVVNASARYSFGEGELYKLNFAVENLFNTEHGRSVRGCTDVNTDGPYDCSSPFVAKWLSLPRTFRATVTKKF